MGSITDRIIAMAEADGVPVDWRGAVRIVSPTSTYESDYGPYGAEAVTFDADDLAALIRIVYRGGDNLPNVTNADGSPIPSPLVAHGVRPSTITAEEIHRLAGGEYHARVVAAYDDLPSEFFGPYEGGSMSMATFGERGRDRYHHVVGSWEYDPIVVDAEGATLTADKVRDLAEPYNIGQGSLYRAYRALTYSGARGVHTVGSFDGSQSHLTYVHHERGTREHELAYHDALAWVPAEVIAEHYPNGPVIYYPETGWVDENRLSAEAEVERWCADMVETQLSVMDDQVRGNVYVVSVEDGVADAEDGEINDWEHLDSCGGYIGDDADPTVYTSGAFYLLVEAVIDSLAKGAELAAKLADQAARHAEWREATDPEEYALAREILGHALPYVFSVEDLDAALARRGLRLIFTYDGRPAVMTTDEI